MAGEIAQQQIQEVIDEIGRGKYKQDKATERLAKDPYSTKEMSYDKTMAKADQMANNFIQGAQSKQSNFQEPQKESFLDLIVSHMTS